jgi:hypothetical protein
LKRLLAPRRYRPRFRRHRHMPRWEGKFHLQNASDFAVTR